MWTSENEKIEGCFHSTDLIIPDIPKQCVIEPVTFTKGYYLYKSKWASLDRERTSNLQ